MSSLVSLRPQEHSVCRMPKDFYSCIDADTTAPLVPAVPSSSFGWCPPTHTVYCPGTRCEEPSARAVVSCEASRGTRTVVESPLAKCTCCVVVVVVVVVVHVIDFVVIILVSDGQRLGAFDTNRARYPTFQCTKGANSPCLQ
jgi:hypothetical protein